MTNKELIDWLSKQSGVEIHVFDTHFSNDGKFKVFKNHDQIAAGDDLSEVLARVMNQ